jgi:hypothetical protein
MEEGVSALGTHRYARPRTGDPPLCRVRNDVYWLSRVSLPKGEQQVPLCRAHQATFGITYPPEPHLP